jgi:GTP cyclohydrolase II
LIADEIARKYNKTFEELSAEVERARRSLVPKIEQIEVVEATKRTTLTITREGLGPLETSHGIFNHFSFRIDDAWEKYSVLTKSAVSEDFFPVFKDPDNLVLRTDSGCETGQLFGDLTCECRDQLHKCMAKIAEQGEGMIICIPRQDGRGLGLPFKLATLRLQLHLGVNTVEASYLLDPAGSRDTRTYAGVVGILKFLRIPTVARIHLNTNNPKKITVLRENGYTVSQEPLVIPATERTARHLEAKRTELGHTNLVSDVKDNQ